MDTQDTTSAPWEQRPGESLKAFIGFTCYRELGPSRSLVAAYKAYVARRDGDGRGRAKDGTGRDAASRERKRAPKYFEAWSSRFDWVARSEAWDRHLDALARAQAETKYVDRLAAFRDEQLQWADQAKQGARKLLSVVLKRLETIDTEKISGMELAKLTRAVVDLSESAGLAQKESLGIDKLLEVLEEEGMLDDDGDE